MLDFIKSHKKLTIILAILVVLPVLIIISAKVYYNSVVNHPFSEKGKEITVTINKNDSLYLVLNRLSSKKLIKNTYVMKYYIKENGLKTTIKPGEYKIASDINLKNFINDLNKGYFDKNVIKVTIPEGKNVEEIGSILESKGLISKEDFIKAEQSYPLPDYIEKKDGIRYNLEGYLFPDTYEFRKSTSGNEIVKTMLNRFSEVFKKTLKDKGLKVDISNISGIITMASIVEKEAEEKEERPIVASVFYNRIKINMKLESCATVEYALKLHKQVLSNNDIKVNSPYNTYKNAGLPVGPICNPGKSCIEAALSPAKTDYKWFVLKLSEGLHSHYFAKTAQEFEQAKKKYIGGR